MVCPLCIFFNNAKPCLLFIQSVGHSSAWIDKSQLPSRPFFEIAVRLQGMSLSWAGRLDVHVGLSLNANSQGGYAQIDRAYRLVFVVVVVVFLPFSCLNGKSWVQTDWHVDMLCVALILFGWKLHVSPGLISCFTTVNWDFDLWYNLSGCSQY